MKVIRWKLCNWKGRNCCTCLPSWCGRFLFLFSFATMMTVYTLSFPFIIRRLKTSLELPVVLRPRVKCHSQFSCPTFTLDGHYELEQLRRYWKLGENETLWRHKMSAVHRTYTLSLMDWKSCSTSAQVHLNKHNVSNSTGSASRLNCTVNLATLSKEVCFLRLQIVENDLVRGSHGHGGSNFDTVVETATGHWKCRVRDTFMNGAYEVECPLFSRFEKYRELCFNITVRLMYVDFTAYVSSKVDGAQPIDLMLFEGTLCHKNPKGFSHPARDNYAACGSRVRRFTQGWLRDHHKNWQWFEPTGPLVELDSNDTAFCLQKYPNFDMIGDSNIQLMADYFLSLTGDLDPALQLWHGDLVVSQLSFKWNKRAREIRGPILDFLGQNSSTSRRKGVLVVSAGAWDLVVDDVTTYLQKSAPTMVEYLRKVKQDPVKNSTKVIWVSNGAYSAKNEPSRSGKRNNYAIAAANAFISDKMKSMGVDVLDSFSITAPRDSEVVCQDHYLCRQPGKSIVYGDVGKALGQLLLNILCVKNGTLFRK